ncbi:unnamed protein product [uncultured bacterium]|nr:unnamed protein product [uncultured bacterium]
MLVISCSACQKKLAVKEDAVGKTVKCPGCGQLTVVTAQVGAPVGLDEMRTVPPAPGPDVPTPAPSQGHADSLPTHPSSETPDVRQGLKPDPSHDSSLTDFLAPPQADDELGRLGKYRILKILGHGGMGVVYRAEDPKLKRIVAIKAMLPALAASASCGKRFLREAQTIAAVKHDNIVNVHDVVEERGVPFMVMEFLQGESLDDRLKGEVKTPLGNLLRIGREIAEGLAAAHAKGLIHRDIKPGNIWLEAPRGRVKILDFGLARPVADDAGLTQQGIIVGTPSYMAPEQGRGDTVDARSDLFSLGVVLYRMATGAQPFHGADTVATLLAVATIEPAAPKKLNADLPAQLSDLVMKLLEKDPEKRVATTNEVVEVLEEIEMEVTGRHVREDKIETITAPSQVTRQLPSGAPHRRSPLLLGIGFVAVALLLLGGGVASYWFYQIVIIRDKGGNKIAEMKIPKDGKAEFTPDGKLADKPPLAVEKADGTPKRVKADGTPLSPAPEFGTRKFVEWFLAADPLDDLRVDVAGKLVQVNNGDKLPDGAFTIIELGHSNIGMEGIPLLAKVKNFGGGYLPRKNADAWAAAFAKHPTVYRVHGWQTDLTAKGVAALAGLPNLQLLNLHECRSTDARALEAIAKIPTLNDLTLDSEMIRTGKYTLADIQRLQDALPYCKITQDEHNPIPGLKTLIGAPAGQYALAFNGREVKIPGFEFDFSRPVTVEGYVTPQAFGRLNACFYVSGEKIPPDVISVCASAKQWTVFFPEDNQGKGSIVSSIPVVLGTRTHVALVHAGDGTYRLYIDGKLAGSKTRERFAASRKHKLDLGPGFDGLLSEVRVSRIARYDQNFVPQPRFEPDADTLALYHMDDGAGDKLTDSSGHGHHGKIVNAWWVKADGSTIAPPNQYALQFDGKAEVFVGNVTVTPAWGPFTIEAYVAASAAQTNSSILWTANGTGLYINPRWRFGALGETRSTVVSDDAVIDGKWTHVAGVVTDKEILLFVDGKLVGRKDFKGTFNVTPAKLFFGGMESGFVGMLREIRVSDIARYTKDFTPQRRFEPDKHTMALYHADEGAGDKLTDYSGHRHHGTLLGARWVKASLIDPDGER